MFPIDDNLLHDDVENVDGNMHLNRDIDDDSTCDSNQFSELLHDIEEKYNDTEFAKFLGLHKDSETPLYHGCKDKDTRLSSVLELLKLNASNCWSDKSFIALLWLLRNYFRLETLCPHPLTKPRRSFALWEWKWRRYMLAQNIVSSIVMSMLA